MTFTAVWAWATGLGISDVCGGWPGWQPYAAVQAGHVLIGLALAFCPRWAAMTFIAGWICKELLFDLGGCQFGRWVALDSLADLACGVAGHALSAAATKARKQHFRHALALRVRK